VDAWAAERFQSTGIDAGGEQADRILCRDVVIAALWNAEHRVSVRALDMPPNRTKLRERGIASGGAIVYRIVEF
jgi:hypothetical protein